jgi:hypothetical protein
MYKMIFCCNICNFYTLNRYDYKKHIQTKKHISNFNISHLDEPKNKNEENEDSSADNHIVLNILDNSNQKNNEPITPKKINYDLNKSRTCKYCGLCYAYSSGLSRHMKTCNGTKTEEPQITSPNDPNVMNMMNMLLQDNVAFKKIIADVVKNTTELMKTNQDLMANQQATTDKVLELCLNNTNNLASITNNNIYNHKGDNHFSINVFLNEKCKDAMNMSDFVNSIEISTKDMENVGRDGYVKGISNIFIDNLKNTDVHKRPIHCSDRKREVLYVKEHDKWEREGVNSDNLINAVKKVEHKNLVILNEWAKQNPECENSYTHANDMYMKFSKNVQDGEDENIMKVVKNIAKETVIERNTLVEPNL